MRLGHLVFKLIYIWSIIALNCYFSSLSSLEAKDENEHDFGLFGQENEENDQVTSSSGKGDMMASQSQHDAITCISTWRFDADFTSDG